MRQDTVRYWMAALAIMLVLNLVAMVMPAGPRAVAQKPREYKVVEVLADTGRMTAVLNEHAQAGWEFVAIGMGDMNPPRLIFTR